MNTKTAACVPEKGRTIHLERVQLNVQRDFGGGSGRGLACELSLDDMRGLQVAAKTLEYTASAWTDR